MTAFDAVDGTAPVEMLDARSRMTARVITTVVLPPEAVTIVAPAPDMISQVNVEQVLGIPARTYLELLREPHCPVSVASVGKLRVVDRHDFRQWLLARAKAKRPAPVKSQTGSDDDLLTLEEQARLGIKPAPRAATRAPARRR